MTNEQKQEIKDCIAFYESKGWKFNNKTHGTCRLCGMVVSK